MMVLVNKTIKLIRTDFMAASKQAVHDQLQQNKTNKKKYAIKVRQTKELAKKGKSCGNNIGCSNKPSHHHGAFCDNDGCQVWCCSELLCQQVLKSHANICSLRQDALFAVLSTFSENDDDDDDDDDYGVKAREENTSKKRTHFVRSPLAIAIRRSTRKKTMNTKYGTEEYDIEDI